MKSVDAGEKDEVRCSSASYIHSSHVKPLSDEFLAR